MNKVTEIFDMLIDPFNDSETERGFVDNLPKMRIAAMLAYIFPILFFVPVVMDRYSPFCKFHANQSLLWLIVCIVINVISGIIGIIPLIGKIVQFLVSLVMLAVTVLLAYGAYNEKAVKLPVVGDMLKIF